MGETEPKDRARSEETGPDQGESPAPSDPAWPAAESDAWPDDDADQPPSPPPPAPIRDESHVPDDEPHVTPPSEPEWPSEEPGPTAELPVPADEQPDADAAEPAEGPEDDPADLAPDTHEDAADAWPEDDHEQTTAELPRRDESPDDTHRDFPAVPVDEPSDDTHRGFPVVSVDGPSDDTRRGFAVSVDGPSDDTRRGFAVPVDGPSDDTRRGFAVPVDESPDDTHQGFPAVPADGPSDDTHRGLPVVSVDESPDGTRRGFAAVPVDGPSDDTHRGLPAVSVDESPDDTHPGFPAVPVDESVPRPPARLPRRTPPPPRPGGQRKPPIHARPYRPGNGPPPSDGVSAGRPAEATRVVRPVAPPVAAEQTMIVRAVPRPEPAEQTMIVRKPAQREAVERHPESPAEQTMVVPTAPREDAPDDEVAEPRKRRTGLIVAIAVAAVLALAAGVVFGVPGVAERLGLRGEDPVAIAPPPAPVVFAPELTAPGGDAPTPTAAGVQRALAGPVSASGLGTFTGVVVDAASGETLYSEGADAARVPASTTKILSGAAALLALPQTEQLVTRVVRGDEPGTVVIVGGGDPTLSSLPVGEDSVYPGAAHLDDLVEQVKASGPVDTVLVDINRYSDDDFARGWERVDIAAGHITPIVAGMLDGGRSDPKEATTPRSANPARALAEAFAERVGASVPANAATTAEPDAEVLGEVKSAPVAELVDTVLQRSDNVLAETLIREVAIAKGQEPSFDGATTAVISVLRDNGFPVDDLVLRDGSGLSTQNKATAALIAEVLRVAAAPDDADPRTATLRPLLGGLPVAGGSGTLAERYQDGAAADGRGWVRAKTGTLPSVRANSLAGVVLDEDGRLLVFALMADGPDVKAARTALDEVAAALRACGCR